MSRKVYRTMSQTFKTFGPPGTGKTTAMLNLVERELEAGVLPERIAYLSYTNAACDEAVDRAMQKFSYKREQLPWFRTLHSICLRLSGHSTNTLIKNAWDLKDFAEIIGVRFTSKKERARRDDDESIEFSGPEEGDRLLAFDHYRRARLLTADVAFDRWPEDVSWFEVQRFITTYEKWRWQEGLVDFTDLLEQVDRALDVDVVIVDEAQDLSPLQWQALDVVSAKAQRIYVAGDDDQAIFTWAGADPEKFIAREGEITVLGQSYRIPVAVHQLAIRLIDRVETRQNKLWRPRAIEGRVVNMPHVESALETLSDAKTLVLYRTHLQCRPISGWLRDNGLPYIQGKNPAQGLQHREAVIYWERLRKGREINAAQGLTLMSSMTTADGPGVLARLKTLAPETALSLTTLRSMGLKTQGPWYEALGQIKPYQARYLRIMLRRFGTEALKQEPRIRLSTIHGAKGAEADHVVLLTDVTPKIQETILRYPDTERRVFYVGITRAREQLTLVGFNNDLLAFTT
jgi:DNA helicase-2/ATP-dependent DNA helicase PcrA